MELSEKDSKEFILSLEFDKDGVLTSWDNKFLRKDGEVVTKLTTDLGEVEVELNSLYL